MAVPNSRVTSLRAEASPCLSRGRELVMVSVEGVMARGGSGPPPGILGGCGDHAHTQVSSMTTAQLRGPRGHRCPRRSPEPGRRVPAWRGAYLGIRIGRSPVVAIFTTTFSGSS